MSTSNELPPIADRNSAVNAPCRTPDPIGLIAEEHALQRELCDLLEALADGLPHNFDKALAVIAVSILEGSVPRHMRLEEEALFPLLRERLADDDPLHAAMACLEDEHDRDGAMLVELTDALRMATSEGVIVNPDMLGYMLRGYFEGQRRHIAWEDRVVIPAARAVLSPADLGKIQAWIMASDHPRCSHQSVLAIRNARSTTSAVCDHCPSGTAGGLAGNVVPFSNKYTVSSP
jgi:hemerythrin-like domain-containing protein